VKKLISKLFGFDLPENDAPRASKQAARERLELALTYDRTSIGYNALEQLGDEIIRVIAKHLDLDQGEVTVQLDRTMDRDKLIASIPLRINTRSRSSRSPATMKAVPSVRRRQQR